VLHEFDVPRGVGDVALAVDAARPKSVAITFDVWMDEER
jgi:hypothetical protein